MITSNTLDSNSLRTFWLPEYFKHQASCNLIRSLVPSDTSHPDIELFLIAFSSVRTMRNQYLHIIVGHGGLLFCGPQHENGQLSGVPPELLPQHGGRTQ